MSSITVEKIILTGALQIPVLTQAEINALDAQQGQIVYNSTVNYIQIYGPYDNWGTTDIGTGNDLWDIESTSNEFNFKTGVARGENTGPELAGLRSTYEGTYPWASNNRFFGQGRAQGYQKLAIPKDGVYKFEIGGARGGQCQNRGVTTMYGATATGNFYLTKDQKIEVVVGVGGGDYSSPYGNEAGGGGGTWVYDVSNDTLLMVAGGAGGSAGNTWGTSCTRDTNFGRGQSTQGVSGVTCGPYTASAPTTGEGGNASGSYHGGGGGGYGSSGSTGGRHCGTAGGGGGFSEGLKGGLGNTCYTTGGLANSGGFGGGGGGQLSGPGGGGGYTGGCTAGQWSSYSTHGGGAGSYNSATSNNSVSAGSNTTNFNGEYVGAGYCRMTWISE